MNRKRVRKFLHSLDTEDYIEFMKEVHHDYPLKNMWVTEEIIYSWRNDHSIKTEKFYDLIEERDVEYTQEAEDRRQRDLSRIQDMKSTTGLDPLVLFPKEIWIQLLNEVSPEDIRNFREVHQVFRDLTEDTVVGNVFLPLVLGIKIEPFWREQQSPSASNQPKVKQLRCLAQYTQLRLVSKSLRNAVDCWFEDDLIFNLHNGEKTGNPSGLVQFDLLLPRDQDRLLKMKTELEDSSGTSLRFFTRSLGILPPMFNYDGDDEDEDEQLAQMLLQRFFSYLDYIGPHIWYFSFEFKRHPYRSNAPDFVIRYNFLLECLSRMPNLKWLKVLSSQAECVTGALHVPYPPPLTHLERLDMELSSPNRYVLPVLSQLFYVNSHVKILNLRGLKTIEDDFGLESVTDVESHSVQVLSIGGQYEDDIYDDTDTIMLQSIADGQWPLKRIDMDLQLENKSVYTVIRVLNKFQTLERISLSIKYVTIGNDVTFLKLPQLTHFELKLKQPFFANDFENAPNSCFFFSLQFLLYAKKLNTLIWKCDMEKIWWKVSKQVGNDIKLLGEMIDFGGGVGDISRSNIWHVFRGLKMVKVVLERQGPNCVQRDVISKVYRRSDLDFE